MGENSVLVALHHAGSSMPLYMTSGGNGRKLLRREFFLFGEFGGSGYFPTTRTTKLSLIIAGRCLWPDGVPEAGGANSAVGK